MRAWSPGFDPGIAYRLYLPESWTKPQIARAQIEAAAKAGVARGIVPTDAGCGSDGALRAGVTALGLSSCGGRAIDAVGPASRPRAAASQTVERARTQALARTTRP